MIHQLFADPGQFVTPESVVAEYFTHHEEISMLVGCPRCHSLNIRQVEIEKRRLLICHDCGDLCEANPVN